MRIFSTLLVGSLLAASPAAALTVTETFETLVPKDTPIAGSLVSPVGTFTGLAGTPFANVFIASPGYTNFGPGNNPTTSSILVANGDESFDVTLAFQARSISMELYLNDLGPASVEIFNGATSLFTFNFAADASPANNFVTIGVTSFVNPITRFTFNSTNGGSLNTGIDNVTITAVPEPATWAMMIGGFALAGAAMRRREQLATA